jgi:hypothetical protein
LPARAEGKLQELGAWKSEAVKRYAHFAPEQMRKAADRLATFWYTGPKAPAAEAPQVSESLVPAVGIEPTTNGLQIAFVPRWNFVNQALAALANLKTDVIKAQLRHSKSGEGTIYCRCSFSAGSGIPRRTDLDRAPCVLQRSFRSTLARGNSATPIPGPA